MSEQADRGALAEVLAGHLWHHTKTTHCACGWRSPLAQLAVDGYLAHVADAALDWLAQRDRRVGAEALREAAEDLAPRPSSERPCDNPEDCCGSAAHCDAVRPMRRVVGEGWLRERADRIERGE